jgi:two-component system, LytTR family, sensor kinase
MEIRALEKEALAAESEPLRVDLTQHPLMRARWLRQRWLIHPLFWLSYVAFFALIGGDSFLEAFKDQLVVLPVKLAVVYLTLYLLIPKLLLRGSYWRFAGTVLLLLLLSGLLQRAVIYFWLYPVKYPGMPYGDFFDAYSIIKHILTILYVLLFASAIKIVKHWYQDQQKAKALEQEKLHAELKFLKAQVHPHFLFNTLNNLYALTLKQSEAAPEVVLRLSGMVHYMLYDTMASEVPLSREIECLHNYIALEKIRYGHRLELSFEVSGAVTGIHIAPMLLLPFVENSFKHGVSDHIQEQWITLHLNLNHHFLTLKVENSRPPRHLQAEKDYTGGIGLKNVRRRLQLLYPGRHELRLFDEDDAFLVVLKIDLSPHPTR